MNVGFKYSLILHAFFILICFVYISRINDPLSTERIITVDLVKVKSGTHTNLKNSPIQTKKDSNAKKKIVDSAKSKSSSPILKKNVESVKSSSTDSVLRPEKVVRKNKDVENKLNKEMEKVLDSLEKNIPSEESSISTGKSKSGKKNLIMSDKPYDKSLPLTMAERDNIKMQIERKFFNPVVLDFNSGEIIIKIKLDMRKNGEIEKLKVLNSSYYNKKYSDAFVSLKDSLVRAAHMASPLQGLDEERYEGRNGWKEIELVFDAYYLMHN